jgi:DNA-binding transcriptional ArsR family regulator
MATPLPRDEAVDPLFDALADRTRRHLMTRLASRPRASATELAKELPISRQAVVKQLAALGQAGLVDRVRDGRAVRYRLTPAPLSEAVAWMTSVGSQWDERLAALARQVGAQRAPGARR